MNGPASNRRFRFSLRMLFAAVTLAACWLGYYANWIHQRHAFIRANQRSINEMGKGRDVFLAWKWDFERGRKASAPAILRLFGEKPVEFMRIHVVVEKPGCGIEPPELCRAKQLFPETQISWTYVDRNGAFFTSEEEN